MADGDAAGTAPARRRGPACMRFLSRALVILWTSFWLYFGLASGIGEGLDAGGVILHTLMPGGIFAALAAVAWRWERPGGWVLVALSLAGAAAYMATFDRLSLVPRIMTATMLAMPSLVAGWLFLAARRARAEGAATGRPAAVADALALGLGGLLLALSALAMLWMVGGGIWYGSPWGQGRWDLGPWLGLVAANLLFLGLVGAALVRQARACLGAADGARTP